VCTGLVVSVVVAWRLGATQGALALAVLLAVSAIARAVLPRGPVALTVRSRTLDTTVLLGLALGVGILSQVIPTR
jgi:threonine/homoserine efflux transporter RhtA